MKLLPLGIIMLIVACAVSLVTGGQSKRFIDEGWLRASGVLPRSSMNKLASIIPAYTGHAFELLPSQVRGKVVGRLWSPVELVIFRLLLAWHVAPAFLIAAVIGFAEGRWARASQKGLVKIHSPVRFRLAMSGLAGVPILVWLWVAAPLFVPVTVLLSLVCVLSIFSLRNLIVHAPMQF